MKDQLPSFEEFHTARRRQRAWEDAWEGRDESAGMRPTKLGKEYADNASSLNPRIDSEPNTDKMEYTQDDISKQNATKNKPWSRISIGQTLEMFEVQTLIVILIYFDLIASTIKLVMMRKGVKENTNTMNMESSDGVLWGDDMFTLSSAFSQLLHLFTEFTLFFFVLETGALLYAFGSAFFSHFGYCLDLLVIISSLYSELSVGYNDDAEEAYGSSILRCARLLGFLRVWRLARLVNTTLEGAKTEHDATKQDLQDVKEEAEKIRAEVGRLLEMKQKEVDHRKQTEKMLQGYKDQVETLTEALKIAAFDVAGVAQEEFEEVKDQEKKKEDEVGEPTLITDVGFFRDENGDEFYDGNVEDDKRVNTKIVVHEDGSFGIE